MRHLVIRCLIGFSLFIQLQARGRLVVIPLRFVPVKPRFAWNRGQLPISTGFVCYLGSNPSRVDYEARSPSPAFFLPRITIPYTQRIFIFSMKDIKANDFQFTTRLTEQFTCGCFLIYADGQHIYIKMVVGRTDWNYPRFRENKPILYSLTTRRHCSMKFNFTTVCDRGFKGVNCDITCNSSEICNDSICPPGYTYNNGCYDINECDSNVNPCENDGRCINTEGSFYCYCYDNNYGTRCEKHRSPCRSCPCLNGGTCTAVKKSYHCKCSKYFYGKDCQLDVDECDMSPSICLNGGSCTNFFGGFVCTCRGGYKGYYCETYDSCLFCDPCQNNGTCETRDGDSYCRCQPGFTGMYCGTEIPDEEVLPYVPLLIINAVLLLATFVFFGFPKLKAFWLLRKNK